jgi:tRNA G18 (ribose-2'-O)-methylase SpoU
MCPRPLAGLVSPSAAEWRYAILGLTANQEAEPFHQAKFPQKAVLVLGRELTGIPHEIEQSCDRTLTIPQYGMADSLNVQTAAAIAIYEYIHQWGMAALH